MSPPVWPSVTVRGVSLGPLSLAELRDKLEPAMKTSPGSAAFLAAKLTNICATLQTNFKSQPPAQMKTKVTLPAQRRRNKRLSIRVVLMAVRWLVRVEREKILSFKSKNRTAVAAPPELAARDSKSVLPASVAKEKAEASKLTGGVRINKAPLVAARKLEREAIKRRLKAKVDALEQAQQRAIEAAKAARKKKGLFVPEDGDGPSPEPELAFAREADWLLLNEQCVGGLQNVSASLRSKMTKLTNGLDVQL
jgi:hypothetical protein